MIPSEDTASLTVPVAKFRCKILKYHGWAVSGAWAVLVGRHGHLTSLFVCLFVCSSCIRDEKDLVKGEWNSDHHSSASRDKTDCMGIGIVFEEQIVTKGNLDPLRIGSLDNVHETQYRGLSCWMLLVNLNKYVS